MTKPVLWRLLERKGMNEKFLESLIASHECPRYNGKGKEEMSDVCIPAKE